MRAGPDPATISAPADNDPGWAMGDGSQTAQVAAARLRRPATAAFAALLLAALLFAAIFAEEGLIASAVAIVCIGALAGLLGQRLGAQLERTRGHVADQLRHGRSVLDHHEEERERIADQLHEQLAQTLAAALMALSLLENEAGESRVDCSRIEMVRGHMRDCLVELRGLADSLRPAVLADLGLREALRRACAEAGERSGRQVAFHADAELERLSPGVETTAYRTVEEVLEVVPEPSLVSLALADEESRLRVSVTARADGRDPTDELARTRSRLQIVGGDLRTDGPAGRGSAASRTIEAEIPLVAEA